MKRSLFACLAALICVFASGRVEAQYRPFGGNQSYGPPSNPLGYQSFSPYLNMTRGGTNAAVNYYGMVQPQLKAQQSIQQLQQQQQVLEQQQTTLGLGGMSSGTGPVTGHSTQFGNYSHYYPSSVSGSTIGQQRR